MPQLQQLGQELLEEQSAVAGLPLKNKYEMDFSPLYVVMEEEDLQPEVEAVEAVEEEHQLLASLCLRPKPLFPKQQISEPWKQHPGSLKEIEQKPMTFSMNYNTTIVLTEESLDSIPL
jgi:hypothetical protein